MLVASSPIVPDWPFNQITSDRCTCRPGRSFSAFQPSGPAKLHPAVQAGAGPVRRWVGFRRTVPSAWRFQPFRCFRRICVPCGSQTFRAIRNHDPPCRNRTFARSFWAAAIRPTTARHSQHLRFAKSVHEERSRRVFQRCCGHRCRFDWFELIHSLSGAYTFKRAANFSDRKSTRLNSSHT